MPCVLKVFIQRQRTREYYAGDGEWVVTKTQARDYLSSVKAVQLVVKEKLADVNVVLLFATERETITFPLTISHREDHRQNP